MQSYYFWNIHTFCQHSENLNFFRFSQISNLFHYFVPEGRSVVSSFSSFLKFVTSIAFRGGSRGRLPPSPPHESGWPFFYKRIAPPHDSGLDPPLIALIISDFDVSFINNESLIMRHASLNYENFFYKLSELLIANEFKWNSYASFQNRRFGLVSGLHIEYPFFSKQHSNFWKWCQLLTPNTFFKCLESTSIIQALPCMERFHIFFRSV